MIRTVLSWGSEIFSQVQALQLVLMSPNLPMSAVLQHDEGAERPQVPWLFCGSPWDWGVVGMGRGARCMICLPRATNPVRGATHSLSFEVCPCPRTPSQASVRSILGPPRGGEAVESIWIESVGRMRCF